MSPRNTRKNTNFEAIDNSRGSGSTPNDSSDISKGDTAILGSIIDSKGAANISSAREKNKEYTQRNFEIELKRDENEQLVSELLKQGKTDGTDHDEVDKILKHLNSGTIVFNVQRKINIDNVAQIHLILSLVETENALKSYIVDSGEKEGASIQVSKRIQAQLSGPIFNITAITPELQAVSESGKTEWKWEIYPSKQGKHKLHLILTAFLNVDDHDTPRTITSFDRYIEVYVTPIQTANAFVMDNWQWLWATILVPISGWLWSRKKRVT